MILSRSRRIRAGGRRSRRTSSLGTAVLFSLPAIAIISVFHLYGAGRNVYMSLTDWTLAGADFVGLRNYIDLVQNGEFWNSVKVTGFFGLVVPVTVVVAIPVAYLLHYVVRKSYLYRLLLFVPFVVPTVATSLVWARYSLPLRPGCSTLHYNPSG